MTGTVTQDFPRHVYHPLPAAACGAPPPPDAAAPSSGTPHRTGALRHNDHGFVSTPAHIYGVQPDPGRTSRSGGSPVFHAPHKNAPLSASGIRERNTASLVSLASPPPPLRQKAPAGSRFSHEGPLDIFSCYQHTTPGKEKHPRYYSHRPHHAFPYSSVTSLPRARFFLLYAEERSMPKRSQMLYTALVWLSESE